MRILMVSQAYYPFLDKGGPAVKVRSIAEGLAQQGHQLTVLTADYGLRRKGLPHVEATRTALGWRSQSAGVETIYLSSLFRYRSLAFHPGAIAFCRRFLEGCSIVHIFGLYDLLGPIVAQFCEHRHIPYVLEPMGMFRPIARSIRLKKVYHWLFGGRLVRRARYLIATSQQEKKELAAGGIAPERIAIRRNGIAPPDLLPQPGTFRRKWNIAAERKVVLFLGRLVSKKSPDMMIQAFSAWQTQVRSQTPAVLVMAGPPEETLYLQRLQSLSVPLRADEIVFTGPLYDQAKWAAYRDADVFVLPSQNENFGNTAAESVVAGTPVIVTETCGITPLLEGRAGIVIPHGCSALQEALTQYFARPELQGALRAGCTEVAGELSWEAPLRQLEEIYAMAMQGRSV